MTVPLVYDVNKLHDGEDKPTEKLFDNVDQWQALGKMHEVIRDHQGPVRFRPSARGTWGRWMSRPEAQQRIAELIRQLHSDQFVVTMFEPLGSDPRWSVRAQLMPYRSRILEWCEWGINHEGQIHYVQKRPMNMQDLKPGTLPLKVDCSEWATGCFDWAGVPGQYDPTGFGFDGAGSSFTMDDHLPTIGFNQLKPADLVVYGEPNHVSIIMNPGHDAGSTITCSHGEESGPERRSIAESMSAHKWFKLKRSLPF